MIPEYGGVTLNFDNEAGASKKVGACGTSFCQEYHVFRDEDIMGVIKARGHTLADKRCRCPCAGRMRACKPRRAASVLVDHLHSRCALWIKFCSRPMGQLFLGTSRVVARNPQLAPEKDGPKVVTRRVRGESAPKGQAEGPDVGTLPSGNDWLNNIIISELFCALVMGVVIPPVGGDLENLL